MKIISTYFSPAHTTEKVATYLANGFGKTAQTYNLITENNNTLKFEKDDLLIIALPVYCGRIPSATINKILKLNGNGANAIIAVVYGNIHIGDALKELYNLIDKQNFHIIGAGAFIGQHSMAKNVANQRPDSNDFSQMDKFINDCKNNIKKQKAVDSNKIVGNFPYAKAQKLPAYPKPSSQCTKCGICAKICPTNAIDKINFDKIDKSKCISCMACVNACPSKCRKINNIVSFFAKSGLSIAGKTRKEPIWFV